jgi:GAF domain-containing protein
MRVLELFELQSDEGPCIDSYRQSKAIINLDLSTVTDRWPRFIPRARADGVVSVHCLPMRLRGRTIGVLNMFRSAPGGLEQADVVAAQALADIATIAILQHQDAIDAQTLNHQLSEALNSRIVIEQAKGMISEAARVDMDQAFSRLRGYARSHNLRLTDLCRRIVEGTLAPRSVDPVPPRRAS